MNLGTTRWGGRPKNRWQDEVREDGQIGDGEGWQEKVHNREEWKKLLRTARNRRILHMPKAGREEGGKEGITSCHCREFLGLVRSRNCTLSYHGS
jgi:hypothetical protein